MARARMVATLDRFPSEDELEAAAALADWLEVRVDRAGEIDPAWLRARFRGPLLYTIGDLVLPAAERRRMLRRAAQSWDLVSIGIGDCTGRVLEDIPAEKRVLVWRGAAASLDDLRDVVARLTATAARLYVVELIATNVAEQLLAIELLQAEQRDDLVAFAGGTAGVWTRPLSARLGAPVVFGRAGDDFGADGTPPLTRLADDFGLPDLWPARELFAMVGDPVSHSLSPRIHNTGYRALGREALYVALRVDDFGRFWRSVVATEAFDRAGIPLRGISVVSPHKAVAVGAAGRRSNMVERARSTNLLRREDDGWFADTTDADGVMLTLRDHSVTCRNRRAAVVGCGGSGRAMAAALQDAGADVTLVNRGFERGSLAVTLLRMPYMPLSAFSAEPYSIFVNATPVGRESDELPFSIDKLPRDAVVVDLAYRQGATSLIQRTRGPGRVTIDGMEMLLAQALQQFRLMTGEEMPESAARQVLGLGAPLAAAEQR